jgi:hypothetical protein
VAGTLTCLTPDEPGPPDPHPNGVDTYDYGSVIPKPTSDEPYNNPVTVTCTAGGGTGSGVTITADPTLSGDLWEPLASNPDDFGGFAFAGGTCANGLTLLDGQQCTINVTFTPRIREIPTTPTTSPPPPPYSFRGTLTITHNGTGSPELTFFEGYGDYPPEIPK